MKQYRVYAPGFHDKLAELSGEPLSSVIESCDGGGLVDLINHLNDLQAETGFRRTVFVQEEDRA